MRDASGSTDDLEWFGDVPETAGVDGDKPDAEAESDSAVDPEWAALEESFLRTRLEEATSVPTLLDQSKLDEIARIGHQIKGSAAVLGFPDVGEAGRALEAAAKQGNTEDMLQAAGRLQERIQAALVRRAGGI